MSQSIEERVVQMKFENGQFEKGVATSINTMNSLKKSMNFDDAVKGFQKLDDSAKSVDMSHLGNAVEAVRVKFSFLDRFAIQVMDRIANKILDVVGSAKKMVDSLSVDQVNAGWSKFEQKTAAVQTIMAATAEKFSDTGEQMAVVNEQLDKLNWFTDETSYNFLDMVNNIGKFTSNNIDLETSVTAMQGISNWAAISGATINEAGRAMYNLSQAVATGSVKLIDWKSIENANMATSEFKKTAIETAAELGTLTKTGEDTFTTLDGKIQISTKTFAGFNDSLQKGWFSSEVLLATLDRYGAATNKLNEIYAAMNENVTTSDIISAIDDYTEALGKARKEAEDLGLSTEEAERRASEAGKTMAQEVADEWNITLEQATEWLSAFDDETMQFGLKAFKAAQEAKTLTDAIEATKDAVSTGWMKSFEMLFGDYLEAKELWTGVANQLYDLFAGMTSARNTMLAEWKDLGGNQYIADAILGLLQTLNNIKFAVVEGIGYIVGELDAQRLLDFTKAVHGFILSLVPGVDTMVTIAKATAALTGVIDMLVTLLKGAVTTVFRLFNAIMGESKLNVLGFVDNISDAILRFREWFYTSTILTDAIDQLVSRVAGLREWIVKFIESVKSIPLVQAIITGVRDTWGAASEDIFGFIDKLKDGIKSFIEWIKNTKPEIRTIEDLKNVFKQFYKTVIEGRINVEENFPKMVEAVRNFGKSIIDALSPAGTAIYNFVEAPLTFLKDILFQLIGDLKEFVMGIRAIDVAIVAMTAGIIVMLKSVTKTLDSVSGIVGKITAPLKTFGTAFSKWTKAKQIKEYAKAIMYLAIALKMLSDIEPERALMSVGLLITLGAAVYALSVALDKMDKGKGKTAKATIEFTTLALAVLAIVGALALLNTLDTDNLSVSLVVLAGLIAGMGAIAIALNKFSPEVNKMSVTILAFSTGVLLLVAALKSISRMDSHDMMVGLVGLVGIMTTLGVAMRIMTKSLGYGKTSAIAGGGSILAFAVAIKILISALKSISKLNPADAMTTIFEITALMTGLSVAMRIMTGLGGSSGKFKAGSTFLALAVSLNLLVPAIKGLAGIQEDELRKAKNVIAQLGLIFVAAIGLSEIGGSNSGRVGLMLLEMAAAITILTLAVRAMGGIDDAVLLKGVTAVTVIGLMFSTAIAASRNVDKSKGALTAMTVALGILMLSVWELGKLPLNQLVASVAAVSAILLALGGSIKLISGMQVNAKILITIGLMTAATIAIGYLLSKMVSLEKGDITKAIYAAGAISLVLVGIAGAMRIMSGVKGLDTDAYATLGIMTIIVGALGLVLTALVSTFPEADISKVIGIVVALDMLIPMLAGCMLLLDKIRSAPNKTTMKKFMQMSAVFAAIGVVIYGITAIAPSGDISKAIGIVAAIDLLLPVMTGCMMALATIRKSPPVETMNALWGFVGVVTALGSVIGLLSSFDQANIATAIGLVAAIDMLLPMLTGCIIALNAFGGDSLNKEALIGIAALGGIADVLLLALIGFTQIADINFDDLMTVVLALDALLAVLTPCFLAINAAGTISPTVIQSAAIAGLAMDAIGALLTVLVWTIGQFPPETLRKGAENGALIGQAIGGFLGGILGGIVGGTLTAIIQVIPALGTALSQFITNAAGFLDGMKDIDAGMIGKAAALTGVIIALAAADFILAVETLAGGFLDLLSGFLGAKGDFKVKMQEMGEAINAFVVACGDVDAGQVKTAAEAAHILVDLEGSIPRQGGKLQSFLGTQDIGEFGKRLGQFGMALKLFVFWVKDITESDVAGASAAASAMSEVEAELPPYGGKLQEWFGERDISKFGERLVSFGESLADYAEKVKNISADSVQGSADAGQILSDLESDLVFSGGFVTKFLFGEKSLSGFGERLTTFGQALVDYAEKVKNISADSVQGSADAIAILAEMEKNLDVTGGVKGFWFGDSSFSGFADNLSDLGAALKTYDESISDVDISKVNTVSGAIQRLVDLAQTITTTGTWAKDLVDTVNGIIDYFLTELQTKESTITDQGTKIIYWLVMGFSAGVLKYGNLAAASGTALANRIRTAIEKTLEINSPSVVMKEDGKWIVKGLAEGIKSDMSAEEAASKKAQNIESAFKSVFSKSSTLKDKYSNEYELWTLTEGKDADELTKFAKEYEYGVRELKRLADETKIYSALMETYRKTFGEDSNEFLAAQEKYNKSLIDMYKQRDKVDKLAAQQLTINKPSATMLKSGKWLVESLAYGITADTTAEEAAAQKVKNIEAAFKDGFDKIDLTRATKNAEYELWQAREGANLPTSSTAGKGKEYEHGREEMELLAEEIYQNRLIQEAVLQEFGEESDEYIKATNTVTTSLAKLYEKQNELKKLTGQSVVKDWKDYAKEFAAIMKDTEGMAEFIEYWDEESMEVGRILRENYAAQQLGFADFEAYQTAMTTHDFSVLDKTDTKSIIEKALRPLTVQIAEDSAAVLEDAARIGLTNVDLSDIVGEDGDPFDTSSIIASGVESAEVSIVNTVEQSSKKIGKSVSKAVKSGTAKGLDEAAEDTNLQEKAGNVGKNIGKGIEKSLAEGAASIRDKANTVSELIPEAFKEKLKIRSPSQVMCELGEYAIIGLENGIKDREKPLTDIAIDTGKQVCIGIKNGISSYAPVAIAAAQQLASEVASKMRSALGVNSPSKVADEIGRFIGQGLANGIEHNIPTVNSSSEKLAEGSIDALAEARGRIQEILDSDDDMLVLTPVLDMDTLVAQARSIGGILNQNDTLNVRAANLQVGEIATRKAEIERQNGSVTDSGKTVTNYNYTQNNYSPKALSQAEIYRKTKNQFSRLKGATQR